MTMKRVPALTWTTLILATDLVWLLGLVVCALAGLPIARHHLEAASIALAVGFCLHVVSVSRESGRPRLPSWTTPPRTVLVVPAAVAVIAFAWSVRLGPLSDDFVLRQWAASGDWATAGWDFFRPLPLALWSLVIPIGDWPALHVANIAIHAINSGLVAALVHGWYGRRAAVAAGVTFALLPTNIEAVAWTAGIFDLVSTLFVLLACLVWLGRRHQRLHIIALAACCVAGLLAKESTVALVPLLAMLAIMASPDDGPDGRRQIETLAISSVAVIAVLIARSAWTSSLAGHLATFPSDRRAVKDLVLRPFAGLVTPVSTDRGLGPIVYVIGLVAIGLLVMILVEHWRNRQTGPPGRQPRLAGTVVAIAWIAIGSLPLLGTLFVAPTLEGGRYLYLPAVGFSFFIGAAASQTGRTGAIGIAAVVALWLLYMPSMQERRHVWLEAAGMRDALLTQARALVLADRCGTLHVDDAPDSVRGAFVFRVGLTDALSDMPYTARGPDCTARWSQTRLVPRAE